jgi:hypothetical protein
VSPWLAGATRWADRVEQVCGVLLAGGVAEPDPALVDLVDAALADGERLGAEPARIRLQALREHVGRIRATTGEARREAGQACWEECHGLMAWIARYRREIQFAALRLALTRAEEEAEPLGDDADLVVIGVLPAGRRWFAHGRFVHGGASVMLVDEVRGDGDPWNTEVISALFQAKIVPAQVWAGVIRLPAGHPTERSGPRVVARPAFQSRPQVVIGALRPALARDPARQRLHAVREGDGVIATLDRRPASVGELAAWNLWKATGDGPLDAWGWAHEGVLLSVETALGIAFVAVDARALPLAGHVRVPVPADLGERVAAALGGPFADAWRDPGAAWDLHFASATRDSDVAGAAGRVRCLVMRGEKGVDEAMAAALGRVARGEVTALELLALDLAWPGALELVPPERLRRLAMSGADPVHVDWAFERSGRIEER